MILIDLIAGFVFTWIIGLLPAYLIRFHINKKPIRKRFAIPLAFLFSFIQLIIILIITAGLGEPTNKTHGALGIVALVSFYIMTKKGDFIDKKGSWRFFLILLIFVICISGFIYFTTRQSNQNTYKAVQVEDPPSATSPVLNEKNENTWKEYYLDSDKYKISLPTEPTGDNKQLSFYGDNYPYVLYASNTLDSTYYSGYIDISKYTESKPALTVNPLTLDEFSSSTAANNLLQQDLYSTLFGEYQNFREIEKPIKADFYDNKTIHFTWKKVNENVFIKGKIIIVDNQDVYLLLQSDSKGDFENFEKFIYSWKPYGMISQ